MVEYEAIDKGYFLLGVNPQILLELPKDKNALEWCASAFLERIVQTNSFDEYVEEFQIVRSQLETMASHMSEELTEGFFVEHFIAGLEEPSKSYIKLLAPSTVYWAMMYVNYFNGRENKFTEDYPEQKGIPNCSSSIVAHCSHGDTLKWVNESCTELFLTSSNKERNDQFTQGKHTATGHTKCLTECPGEVMKELLDSVELKGFGKHLLDGRSGKEAEIKGDTSIVVCSWNTILDLRLFCDFLWDPGRLKPPKVTTAKVVMIPTSDEIVALAVHVSAYDVKKGGKSFYDIRAMPRVAEVTGGSSKKVNASGALDNKRISDHQKRGSHFQRDPSGQSGVGSAQHRWSPRHQQKSGSTNGQGSTPQSAGRKTQMVNGNHLLNFHYDPISRPQPRPPAKRQQKRKPYNKDLFLQANYKFMMLDSGNYTSELIDPDKTLRWEDIICVKYFTPVPAHCPICLEDLLCPQMTSCGHIFCFPCILRYFLLGEDNHKRECWKKCPLCFMMISSKDLYTIYIESVKEHSAGDTIEFMLLTRQKDSLTLSLKSKQDSGEEVHDSFSKFTFTTDVDLSVRKAISELDSWLARADSGLVDDLERLPYVCAAMEQLEERKKYWNDHRVCNGNNYGKDEYFHSKSPPTGSSCNNDDWADPWGTCSTSANGKSMWLGSSMSDESNAEPFHDQTVDVIESNDGQDKALSSSFDDTKNIEMQADGSRDKTIKDSYDFYQAVDGQHLILHPLNMKCLLHHYGSYDKLPQRLSGKIIQLETVTQSEAMRRRYRYLSHFSLTTTFQLCEVDLSVILPSTALSPFMDEINNREKQRKLLARKEQEEKIKAEAAAASHYMSFPFDALQPSHDYAPFFSLDDFEALGNSAVTSSSPPNVGERPLFSNVTRLGFAAVSPSLRSDKAQVRNASTTSSGGGGTSSFANIISRTKVEVEAPPEKIHYNEAVGKKGKKHSRVLLSTAGGRRY